LLHCFHVCEYSSLHWTDIFNSVQQCVDPK
jgi:hypothetical protein